MNRVKSIFTKLRFNTAALKSLALIAFVLGVVILVPGTRALAGLPYDPFEKYGKTLPWSEIDGWTEAKAMIETKTPASHYADFQYYAVDFARYLDSDTLDTKVHAISDGTIIKVVGGTGSDYNGGLGRYIVIDHGNGYTSRYGQMGIMVFTPADVGTNIRQGQVLGWFGETGNVTGPNLELEIKKNGVSVNPIADGTPYTGEFKKLQGGGWEPNWETPVSTFNNLFWKFRSSTTERPNDPDNPWDPPIIDPLEKLLHNYGFMFPAGMIAEPINPATGNFVHRNTDLDLNSQEGPELKFERFYNSFAQSIGITGQGWSNSYSQHVIANEDQQYSVVLSDGRGETFKETDSDPNTFTSTFTRETDFSLGTLTRNDAGGGYKFVYTDQYKTVYVFNSDRDMSTTPSTASPKWGKIEKMTDVNGRSLTFDYDAAGNLIKVSDDFGRYIAFEYGANKLLTTAKDQSGRSVSYVYNFDGRLSQVKKANGEAWNYEYDPQGRITKITDAEGKVFAQNTYDADGRVITQADGKGQSVSIAYADETILGIKTGNTITSFTNARGGVKQLKHNAQQYLIAEKAPNGAEMQWEYNTSGRVTKEIAANGAATLYERDSNGNITKITKPDGYVKNIEYNDKNLPTKMVDSTGTINIEYNSNGKTTKITNQKGYVVTNEYNDKDLLTKSVNAIGDAKEYSYNAQGLLTLQKDSATGATMAYEYDGAGNKTAVTDALGRKVTMEYNSLGKMTKMTDARGFSLLYEYDKNGNLSKRTDETGAATSYISDANENITKITYPNGSTEEFTYDQDNNKISAKDRNGNITKSEYDVNGRKTKENYFDSSNNLLGSRTFDYDSNDNLVKETDPNGNATTYTYDVLNRPTKTTNAEGAVSTSTYNNLGQLTAGSDYEGNVTTYQYDELGRRISDTDPMGHKTTYDYDKKGNLISKTDALGNKTLYFYNSQDKLIAMQNPKGSQAIYDYDVLGRLVAQTNFAGEKTTFKYDNSDNLTQQIAPNGGTTLYEYDARNNLVKSIDPRGNASQTVYDPMGQTIKSIDALGNASSYQYDSNGNLLKLTGENGSAISYKYDGLNRSVEETDARGNKTTYQYDADGNVLSSTDKNGHVTKFQYDKMSRVVKTTDALNQNKTYAYSANGYVKQVTDEAGSIIKIERDKLGQVVKVTNALGNVVTSAYDELGNVVAQSDNKGQLTKYEYDALGNMVKQIDRAGVEFDISYDAGSRKTGVTMPSAGITQKTLYDAAGHMVQQINGEGGVTEYSYDIAGNVVSIKNPRGQITKFDYDAMNRQVKQTDANNGAKTTEFDKVGRIIKTTDQNGNPTTYEYDATNNLTKTTRANGAASTFVYDAEGNLVSMTNARGFTTKYTYDELNRQTSQILPDNSVVSNQYNSVGKIIAVTDPKSNKVKYEYDAIGNILSETDAAGFKTQYQYDANANVISMIDKNGDKFSFQYDVRNNQTKITDPFGKSKSFEYDSLGRNISVTNERGAVTKYVYDKNSNIIKTVDANNQSQVFQYDPNSNLVKVTDELGRASTVSYDNIDHVTQKVNALNGKKSYTYDKVGNILATTDEKGNTTKFSYDAVYNKIAVTNALGNTTKYSYDLNTNLVAQTDANNHTVSFAYDNRDRQVSQTLAGGEVFKYEYDANGNKTKQITPKGTSFTFEYDARNMLIKESDPLGDAHQFQYDPMGRIAQSQDAMGNKTQYQYDALSRLTKVLDAAGSSSSYDYDEVGNLLKEVNANGNATTYAYDLLNRRTKETNQIGSVWSYTYDAVGNMTSKKDPKAQTINYAFDALNRNTGIDYGFSDQNVTFSYDKVGNIISAQRGDLNEQYKFDDVYQLTNSSDSKGKAYSYAYDPVGNRTQITYADGKTAKYEYNKNNQLASLSLTYTGDAVAADNPQTLVTNFTYDANLNLVKQTNPNLTEIDKSYDKADRLTEVANKRTNTATQKVEDFAKYSWDLNANGDKVKETIISLVDDFARCENQDNDGSDGHNPGDCAKPKDKLDSQILTTVRNYGYDPLRRVTQVINNKVVDGKTVLDYTENFAYDKVGNRTSYEYTSVVPTIDNKVNYTYNAANQLTADTQYDYSYDANGNRLSKNAKDGSDTNKFIYNVADQLVHDESANAEGRVYAGNSQNVKDQITFKFDYEYDAFGRRTAKVNKTDYTVCKGNGEKQGDTNWFDCNNGSGNDGKPVNPNVKKTVDSVAYYGIDRIDYEYDGQTWESLSEYFTRMQAPEDPKKNPKPPLSEYFNVHTDYFKAGSRIIASDNIAERPVPYLDLCKGNGEHFGDGNWFDCNNGSGNDNNTTGKKPFTGTITPKTNEYLSYYHTDGLGSIVAKTGYRPSYTVTAGVVDITPKMPTPVVYNINMYAAYGKKSQLAFDAPGTPKKDYYEPEMPYAYGFTDWNSKTYSTKEIDIESGDYYYGSRFYDPTIGSWNKLDTYRGDIKDPMSRHRYMFVNDNPVNDIDQYGFSDYQRHYTTNGDLDKLVDKNYDYYDNQISDSQSSIATHQSEVQRLNGIIPGLQATMNNAWWSMYKAHINYDDHVQMYGVLGRLMARGYAMDYGTVMNYMGGQVAQTGRVYAAKSQQYSVAAGNYYGAVAQRDWHSSEIGRLNNYIGAIKTERTQFDGWVDDTATVYKKTYDYGKNSFDANKKGEGAYKDTYDSFFKDNNVAGLYQGFNKYLARHMDNPEDAAKFFTNVFAGNIQKGLQDSQTAYIAEQKRKAAEEERNQSLGKMLLGGLIVVGGLACAAVTGIETLGAGAVACMAGAGVALAATVGEGVVAADDQRIMDTGTGFLSDQLKNTVKGASDLGLVVGGTLVTGGTAITAFAPAATISSLYVGVAFNPVAMEAIVGGTFSLGMAMNSMVQCTNRLGTGSDCSANDYLMIGIGLGGGMLGVGGGSAAAQATYNSINTTSAQTDLHRPSLRVGTTNGINNNAPVDENGNYIDPNSTKPIEGTPDIGHKPGFEWWRVKQWATDKGLTQSQLNDIMNNPDLYQLEDPSLNRAGTFEDQSSYNFDVMDKRMQPYVEKAL